MTFGRLPARCYWPLLLAALFVVSCDRSKEATQVPDLTILQTGRLRGNIYPEGVTSGTAPLQYHGILAGYIRQVRETAAQQGGKVLLIDLGDSLTGSFASHATDSENVVRFFNTLGYNAVVLGNLDADLDPAVIGRLQMPVACPFETQQGESAMPGTELVARFEVDGIPVELLPNFYGETKPAEHPGRFPVAFGGQEGVQPVRDYRRLLGGKEKAAGGLRLFSWFKFESPDQAPVGTLAMLQQLGVDAGLAHRIYSSQQRDAWSEASPSIAWTPPVAENILRDNRGFVLSRLDLAREGSSWRVLHHERVPMVANLAAPDPATEAALAPLAEPINAADEVVATLEVPADRDTILRLYMQALAVLPGAEAVLYSRDSIRGEWGRGPLRTSRIFDSLPWAPKVVLVTLDRAQFDEAASDPAFATLAPVGLSTTGPVQVVTSQFFARLLRDRFALGADAIQPASDAAEFEILRDYVKQHGGNPPLPEGWAYGLGR